MARSTPEAIFEATRQPEEHLRTCHHPDCSEAGLYRAPKSRDQLTEYYWFCLDHVREYNLAWDFFVGMNEDEIEDQRRVDTVWERPSWPLGGDPKKAEERIRESLDQDFGLGGDGRSKNGKEQRQETPLRSEDEKALAILGLERPVTFPEIKARYKELAKKLHPDANGGDKETEERFKAVNQAYSTLKNSFVQ